MRGASWVVDATHFQGCSVQFSLFTRMYRSVQPPKRAEAWPNAVATSKPQNEGLEVLRSAKRLEKLASLG
uniref:Uncharacterized protein n=1 Tax=Oryza brachyantha TaxID=4533 RepID=J3LEA6_ORYBR